MSNKGLLAVLSGPSGAGKGTVLGKAFEREKNLYYSVSVTTRAPRKGEREGVNYFFRTLDQYNEMLSGGEFLETMRVYDNYYGTPKTNVDEKLAQGFDVVLEIDVAGALEVKRQRPDAVMIFLTPSSPEIIKERLRARNTETEEQLEVRMRSIMDELKRIESYDYVVVNDDAERCAKDFLSILRAEKLKTNRNKQFLNHLNGGEQK